MRFGYADPPYVGQAHRYKEKTEVDHVHLIEHLVRKFQDGWLLCCSSPSLRYLLPLCPADVRVGAWVKPFAVFKPNVNPAYAWEPVIWRGGRRGDRTRPTVRDWVSANITLKKGLCGAKPPAFNAWVLDLLGYEDGDELVDLYPGTESMNIARAALAEVKP